MILIDDMILAVVIAIIVLIATIIINPIFCFFGFCGLRTGQRTRLILVFAF